MPLLNAALTASSDGMLSTDRHAAFWRPVIEAVVEAILRAHEGAGGRGVVFAWWGAPARTLRPAVERLHGRYPGVPVRHVDHRHPSAQGDAFCHGDHFGGVNAALAGLGMEPVDWLPSGGWDAKPGGPDG